MAYLDFTHDALLHDAPRTWTAAEPALRPPLGSAERNVLRLSRRDTRASLRAATCLGRRARRVFGFSGTNPLADPRLEALRRFVVLLRCEGDRLPEREEARLLAAGFTAAEVAEVRRWIGREASAFQSKAPFDRMVAAILVAALAVQMLVDRYLAAYLDDGLLGLIGTMVATAAAIGPVRAAVSVLSDVPAARASSR